MGRPADGERMLTFTTGFTVPAALSLLVEGLPLRIEYGGRDMRRHGCTIRLIYLPRYLRYKDR